MEDLGLSVGDGVSSEGIWGANLQKELNEKGH